MSKNRKAGAGLAAAHGSGHVEHTPAPWKAAKSHDGEPERWCVVADSERQYLIAVIENGQPGDCCETEGATARLIAAAPELLEACRELVTAMVQLDKEHHREVWRARAALQKASGQNAKGEWPERPSSLHCRESDRGRH